MLTTGDASLYVHIPFCTKKCPYCHFYVVPNQLRYHPLLFEALLWEWEQNLPKLQGKKIVSLYFGGGTPTLFGPAYLEKLLTAIHSTCSLSEDCEITIEANPEEHASFFAYRNLGINRLSIGVQSLDDRALQTLERQHSARRAIDAIFAAQEAGFANISIDLMYDLPEQTEASWEHTLSKVAELPIQHLSLYNLTIEPHTVFWKRKPIQPDAETSLSLLTRAVDALEQMGLHRYEISAFAKQGFASRHNSGYWTGRSFLGYGPSAFSDWEGERYRNCAHLYRYHRALKNGESPVDFRERLEPLARERERLAIHLRLLEGAPLARYSPSTVAILTRLEEAGLLIQRNNKIALTARGLLLYDTVATEII